MATNNKSCTIEGQKCYHGGWTSYGSTSCYAGKSNGYNPYVLGIYMPAFNGASESLSVTLGCVIGNSSSLTLNWSLDHGMNYWNNYVGDYGSISDGDRIAQGSYTFSGLSASVAYKTISIPTTEIVSGGWYSLVLWSPNTAQLYMQPWTASYHSAQLYYNEGVCHVANGSAFTDHLCYVANGSGFDLCIPYVADGSSWKILT